MTTISFLQYPLFAWNVFFRNIIHDCITKILLRAIATRAPSERPKYLRLFYSNSNQTIKVNSFLKFNYLYLFNWKTNNQTTPTFQRNLSGENQAF